MKISKLTCLLTTLLLFAPTSAVLAQTTGCDFLIATTVSPSDCDRNGIITISLTNLQGQPLSADFDYAGAEYRVSPVGTPEGDRPKWAHDVAWKNLGPAPDASGIITVGTYVDYLVEATMLCSAGGIESNPITKTTTVRVSQSLKYEPINFLLTSTRLGMTCRPTGQISMNFTSGPAKGPYRVEIVNAPQAYLDMGKTLPDLVYEKTTNGLPSTITLPQYGSAYAWQWPDQYEGLPVGNYTIRVTGGCMGQRSANVEIKALTSDFYSNYIYDNWMTPKYDSSTNPTDRHLMAYWYTYTTDLAPYYQNKQHYYQYAFIFSSRGETADNISEDRWLDFTSGNTSYIHYESPDYTLEEMRADASRRPSAIALRVKNSTSGSGGGCTSTETLGLYMPSFQITTADVGCSDKNVTFRTNSSYAYAPYSVIAYPYAWKVEQRTAGESTSTTTDDVYGAPLYASGVSDSITSYSTSKTVLLSPGYYRFTFTDRQGYEVINYQNLTTNTNRIGSTYTSSSTYLDAPCSDGYGVLAYFYDNGTPVSGSTIEYLGASASSSTTITTFELTSQVNLPLKTVDVPDSYNGNVYFFNDNPFNTTTAARRWISTNPNLAGQPGGCWPHRVYLHFEITDACGNTIRTTIMPNSSSYAHKEYYHAEAPTVNIVDNCGSAELTVPNIANLIKYNDYINGFNAPTLANSNVYIQVKPSGDGTPGNPKWPTGAKVTYPYYSGTQYSYMHNNAPVDVRKITFSHSGEYVLQVSQNNVFTTTATSAACVQEYPITVTILPFMVDRLNTIAYRCPTQGGIGFSTSGQIAVRPINGSGGQYLYELFDKDEDPLTAVPILSKTGNDTQGIFGDNEKCTIPGINYGKSWAEMVDAQGNGIDSVQVRITDLGCGRVTPPTAIAIHNLNNVSVLWTIGSPRKCIGDDLQLRAMALGKNTTYRWYDKEGTLLQSGSNPNLDITNLTVDDGGTYKLIIDVDGCPNITKESEIKISVADKQMYWNPAASDNNWHNNTNWLLIDSRETLGFKESASIPAPCTTVHIAGNALHYPSLDAEATPRIIGTEHVGLPACDTIYYHYGSETAYPHYLDYNRAKVQYNFRYYSTLAVPSPTRPNTLTGTQPAMSRDNANYPNVAAGTALPYMLRNRWYMLSTPLKDMTGGDFSMAGKPMLYQRLYNASEPISGFAFHDTFTRPFNNLAEDASQHGYGLAVLAADGWNAVGWNDHSNLQNTAIQGVIELPVYMDKSNDSDIMKAHLQTYDGSASKFEYFKWRDDGDTSVPVLGPMGVYDTKERGYTGYRFVFENEKDTVSSERYPTSADPMTAIYDLPLGEILAGGSTNRVMIGNPLMCHIDFAKIYAANNDVIKDYYYIVEDASENFIPSYTGDIAPLQGFVVEVLPGRSRDYLRLPLEGAYTVVSQSGWDYQNNGPKPPVGGIDAHPRSAALKTAKATGRIDIIASTPYPAELSGIASGDSIRIAANILFDNEGHSDIPKITFPEGIENKAEVFVVSQDGTQINAAQQAGNQPESLKIGLESKYEKEIVLSFRFEGTLVQSATFIDKVTGIRLTVSNGSRYRFTHRYNRNEGGFEGVDSERFELWPTYLNGDGIENGDYFLTAGIQENELRVLTSETLSQVEVVNAAGTVIHKATDINASRYNRPLQVTAGVYLLNISLSDGRIETRKALITK